MQALLQQSKQLPGEPQSARMSKIINGGLDQYGKV